MGIRMRNAAAAAVLGLGVVGAVSMGTEASARPSQCAVHYFCVWIDGDNNGAIWPGDGYKSYLTVPSNFHDEGSSWYNHNTSQRECVIDHVKGKQVYLDVVDAGVNRTDVPRGANDQIDAIGHC